MTATTIKVDAQLRDRLKRQAAVKGVTLGQHLGALADLGDRDDRLRAVREAMSRTTPAEWGDYRREAGEWDRLTAPDGLPA